MSHRVKLYWEKTWALNLWFVKNLSLLTQNIRTVIKYTYHPCKTCSELTKIDLKKIWDCSSLVNMLTVNLQLHWQILTKCFTSTSPQAFRVNVLFHVNFLFLHLLKTFGLETFRNFGIETDGLNWAFNVYFTQLWKSQPAFTFSKLTIETVEQGLKYFQSHDYTSHLVLVFLLLTLNM